MNKINLTKLESSDSEIFLESLQDNSIRRTYKDIPKEISLADVRNQIEIIKKDNFAIRLNNNFIGLIGINNTIGKDIEIGYWIIKKHRGNGFCNYAIKLFKTLVKQNYNLCVFPCSNISEHIAIKNSLKILKEVKR